MHFLAWFETPNQNITLFLVFEFSYFPKNLNTFTFNVQYFIYLSVLLLYKLIILSVFNAENKDKKEKT